jgi:hypothetical protein
VFCLCLYFVCLEGVFSSNIHANHVGGQSCENCQVRKQQKKLVCF